MTLASWLSSLIGGFSNNPEFAVLSQAQAHSLRTAQGVNPLRLLSEGVYVDGLRMNYISTKQFYRYMAELGFTKNQAKLLYFTNKTRLTAIESATKRIANSYEKVFAENPLDPVHDVKETNLDKIKKEYRDAMYKIGYDKDTADKMFETLRPIPTFSIILEWLAKEAFEPEVIDRFGLLKDLPDVFVNLMRAIGVPDSETQRYWIAHWNHLPLGSIGEIYQRFGSHRSEYNDTTVLDLSPAQLLDEVTKLGYTVDEFNDMSIKRKLDLVVGGDRNIAVLDEINSQRDPDKQVKWGDVDFSATDYTEALKLHEIAPPWRDREIMRRFNPLTFTSLQQMYAFALKPDAWFLGRLRDYGYSKGDAEAMLSVWRRKYPYSSKESYPNNLFAKLENGAITDDAVKVILQSRGMPEPDIDYFISKAKDKYVLVHEKTKFTALKKKYLRQKMTEPELEAELLAIFPTSSNRDVMKSVIMTEGDGSFPRYNLRVIGNGLKSGKITKDEAERAFKSLRLLDTDIELILKIYEQLQEPDPNEDDPNDQE